MKKITILIIGLFTLLIAVNNVNAQQAQRAQAPLEPEYTIVYFHTTPMEPGVYLNAAHLTLEFDRVYLPEKPTQTLNPAYSETFLLNGAETSFATRYYMGHGRVKVTYSGVGATGYASKYFIEDSGSDYIRDIDVHIDVYSTKPPHGPH